MADKNTTANVTEQPEVLAKAKGFWDKFSKPIIYIGSAFILLIGGWYAYQNFYVKPNELKANEMIFAAENLFDKMAGATFNKDSVNLVLNGGSLEGNKITGIAGASYLQIGEFDKAIKYLKEFKGNGADQVESKAYILLGHAYAEKKNTEEAFSYYKKAARVNAQDEASTPYALLIAASYADAMGKNKEAIELYKELKEKFPANTAVTSGDVEKHLARLGVFE